MIVYLYNYEPSTLYSKVQHDLKADSFSFDYKGVKFETNSYANQQKGPISFIGILNDTKIPEYDFACNIALEKSTDFECFVEVMCTKQENLGKIVAYNNGKCIKEVNKDNKLLAAVMNRSHIDQMCKR